MQIYMLHNQWSILNNQYYVLVYNIICWQANIVAGTNHPLSFRQLFLSHMSESPKSKLVRQVGNKDWLARLVEQLGTRITSNTSHGFSATHGQLDTEWPHNRSLQIRWGPLCKCWQMRPPLRPNCHTCIRKFGKKLFWGDLNLVPVHMLSLVGKSGVELLHILWQIHGSHRCLITVQHWTQNSIETNNAQPPFWHIACVWSLCLTVEKGIWWISYHTSLGFERFISSLCSLYDLLILLGLSANGAKAQKTATPSPGGLQLFGRTLGIGPGPIWLNICASIGNQ